MASKAPERGLLRRARRASCCGAGARRGASSRPTSPPRSRTGSPACTRSSAPATSASYSRYHHHARPRSLHPHLHSTHACRTTMAPLCVNDTMNSTLSNSNPPPYRWTTDFYGSVASAWPCMRWEVASSSIRSFVGSSTSIGHQSFGPRFAYLLWFSLQFAADAY